MCGTSMAAAATKSLCWQGLAPVPGIAAPYPDLHHCGRGTLQELGMANLWGLVELKGYGTTLCLSG